LKKISILGSTGSIGRSTLEIVNRFPGRFKIVGLAANSNIRLLESQINAFNPEVVAVADESAGKKLKKKNLRVDVLTGEKGLAEMAGNRHADMVVSAIVGSAGLMPTLAAIKAGIDVALACKECLVMAGSVIMAEAKRKKVMVIPVDSEHSAIFQCLGGKEHKYVRKIILTASGGPFLRTSLSELDSVTPEAALKHPNWIMGKKITVDSATLMNKGLEMIEARWLFNLPAERIEVLLHPQSIVHSMVEFIDGSILAQMSVPDMKGPISYALSYPQRLAEVLPSLDFSKAGGLTFEEPDRRKFRCLSLAYDAIKTGGTMPSVLNAANEVAVEAFLNKKILFTEIPSVVSGTMTQHKVSGGEDIEEILNSSDWARKKAGKLVEALKAGN
jgi:1-deoxy-D-xylulose-5-phosphate reductoisomerase